MERREVLPSLLGIGAIGLLAWLMLRGLTGKRPTLRSGYRKIGGKLYSKLREFSTKIDAQKLARVERGAGYRARVVQVKASGRWAVWRSVRA